MNYDIFGDKGFLGLECQTHILNQTNNRIWTPKCSNQYIQLFNGFFDFTLDIGKHLLMIYK